MLIFLEQRLIIYAVPKTGSTALQAALAGQADIVFRTSFKHIPVRRTQQHVGPMLKGSKCQMPEGFAVIREPIDWLHSWYRYRQRETSEPGKGTAGMSFDQYVEDYLSGERQEHVNIGRQARFLHGDGDLSVSHLFAYEHLDRGHGFLFERLGFSFATRWMNESPEISMELSPENKSRLEAAFAEDYALYERAVTYSLGFEPPQ